MKRDQLFIGILAALVLFLALARPNLGWSVRRWFLGSPQPLTEEESLLRENVRLKAELAKLEAMRAQLPAVAPKHTAAVVYSSYPFGTKSELLIGAGEKHGISEEAAVTFRGIFIGQIERVFGETSLVRTVFDERLKLAVRIGNRGVEGLFQGGIAPRVTLIDKKKEVAIGDIIFTSAPGVPYGTAVAEVKHIGLSGDALFQEAELRFGYDLAEIQAVLVVNGNAE
ncbi:hypothetical protein C4587_02435 [Candidatus Parcubacteria bacterium]|nr:MAG: hypothetical protein C4587_02435 [Candidatus Parcubacteria bacterium]